MSESLLKQKYFYGLPVKKILRALPGNTDIRDVIISGTCFSIESVVNTDKLVDAVENKSFHVDERLPYWSELWPSSFALAEYILENKSLFCDKEVLELGCGLGLCGLAAREIGARTDLTDYDPIALYFAKRNYKRNFTDHPDVYYLDWRGPYPVRRFDIIIGSDILYEKRFFKHLFILVDMLLKFGGNFILSEPQRPVAADFFSLFSEKYWSCAVIEKIIVLDNIKKRVNVHHYKLC